jgi:transposase
MPARSKYTLKRRDAICAAVATGCTYRQAALVAGISYETFNEWRKTKAQFSDALEKAEAQGVLSRLMRIQNAAREGAWQADAWWLERRQPEQWGKRDKLDVHHDGELHVRQTSEAIAVIMQRLAPYPDAQLAVAEGLDELAEAQEAEQQQQQQ